MKRALLLGIDAYADPDLALDAPRNDILLMKEALVAIGFEAPNVHSMLSSVGTPLSTAVLRREIGRFFRAAEDGDELLLYFSGHGADQDYERVLIPFDYYRDEPQPVSALIGDHWIYNAARASPATSIIVIVDSCREGIELVIASDDASKSVAPPKKEEEEGPEAPTIAILYSCASNAVSWASSGPQGTSHFTAALTRVLRAEEYAGSLGDILAATRAQLAESQPRHKQQVPFLDERYSIRGRAGAPLRLVVKEDEAARLRQRIERSPWVKLLGASGYWPALQESSPGLARQLEVVCVRAEDLVRQAGAVLGGRGWRSDSAIQRYLTGLELVAPARLADPATIAVSLGAILAYEAALAGLTVRLGESGALNGNQPPLEDFSAHPLPARAWAHFLGQDDDMERRRLHLTASGRAEAAEELLEWQLLTFAHGAGELWAYSRGIAPGARGWLNDLYDSVFALGSFRPITEDERVEQVLEGKRLLRFARLLFADPDELDSAGQQAANRLNSCERFGSGEQLWTLDEVEAAHLVAMAGGLALDARRLPDVVADHLGLEPGLDVDALHFDLDRSRWQLNERTLVLAMSTKFPAVHAALAQLVSSLEQHRSRIVAGAVPVRKVLAELPVNINHARLLPATDALERPAFDPRHLRFSLDQPRIVKMLMGEALYGDPNLALRELYQNALDACRYRRARELLLAHRPNRASQHAYPPHILFQADIINGRPAISCEDNGIGMEERHLRTLFAKAGRRFTHAHEFHLDQAQWQEAGIPFWSNSRFGVGVLSYFMLAEEIEIQTRRVGPEGALASEGVLARVTGSGSLFRIVRDLAAMRFGGTRITLFPKDTAADVDALLRSVLEWLWIPEFDVTLQASTGEKIYLPAGEVSNRATEVLGEMVPVPTSSNSQGHPRLFYVPGLLKSDRYMASKPGMMLDGVRIDGSPQPAAVALNVSEDLGGDVSVDRRRIVISAQVGKWVAARLAEDAGEALRNLMDKRSESIARFGKAQAEPLIKLDERMRAGDAKLGDFKVLYPGGVARSPAGLGLSLYDGALHQSGGSDIRQVEEWDRKARELLALRVLELLEGGVSLPPPYSLFAEFARAKGKTGAAIPLGSQLLLEATVQIIEPRQPHWELRALGRRSVAKRNVSADYFLIVHSYLGSGERLPELVEPLIENGLVDVDMEQARILAALPSSAIRILSTNFNGQLPFEPAVGYAHLLAGAATLNEQPAVLARDAAPLAEAGLIVCDLDRFATLDVPVSRTLLPVLRSLEADWQGPLHTGHILAIAHGNEFDVEKTEAALAPFRQLDLVPAEAADVVAGFQGTGNRLELLSRNRNGEPPFFEKIGLEQLITKVGDNDMDFEEALAALAPLHGSQFIDFDPTRIVPVSFVSDLPTLLSRDYDAMAPVLDRVPFANLCRFIASEPPGVAETAIIAELAEAGLLTLDPDQLTTVSRRSYEVLGSFYTQLRNRGAWNAISDPAELPITLDRPMLHRIAFELGESAQGLLKRLQFPIQDGIFHVEPAVVSAASDARWGSRTRELFGVSRDQAKVSAFDLALLKDWSGWPWSGYAKAVDDLSLMGFEVSEAREFIEMALSTEAG
jgi:hypothetical protein